MSKVEVASAKTTAPGRLPIQIRETTNGGITLAGVTEAEVRTKEEMTSYLSRGSLAHATGSTNMNSQSSHSHAIFTITMKQKKIASCSNGVNDDIGDDILCAKLHLVDPAGSERAKRMGADGMCLKEGIHINKGLLALGNVISALGDEKKRKEGGHVPYRDSKLTRLLQDSLGGNSKTVMIACVSPADTNAEETLNTLKYANCARNIQNKAVINRDPTAAQLQRMRNQIEQLQAEVLFYRSDGNTSFDELQILKHRVSLLEQSNKELQRELKERRLTSEQLAQRALDAQVEKNKLIMQMEAVRNGKSWDEVDTDQNQPSQFSDFVDSDDKGTSKNSLFSSGNDYLSSDEIENNEKEQEHSSLQEKLDRELNGLDKTLQQIEAEMKRFTSSDTSVLKQHYEKKLNKLEQEKKVLQKEIVELRNNLASISSISDDGAQKLKDSYLQKLNVLEAQVTELKASREKEVLQLKKEGRRNEYEMHRLLALNQRQKMVLQRKTEEAALATKRLKDLLESRKASSREASGAGNGTGSGIRAIMQTIEHELEVTVRVHEVRSEYERQMEERARMVKEVARLKEEAEIVKQSDLSTLVSMASQLSEAEEHERIFSGRGCWNHVRSLADVKNIMNHLFNLASSSRADLVQRLRNVRQYSIKGTMNSDIPDLNGGRHNYELRKQEQRNSVIFMDDMDISESEHSDIDASDDDDDDWVQSD
ncbi:hypothetical protein PTKIN_Ptkin09bG0203500 [Pterospermum kingtungense]